MVTISSKEFSVPQDGLNVIECEVRNQGSMMEFLKGVVSCILSETIM